MNKKSLSNRVIHLWCIKIDYIAIESGERVRANGSEESSIDKS